MGGKKMNEETEKAIRRFFNNVSEDDVTEMIEYIEGEIKND